MPFGKAYFDLNFVFPHSCVYENIWLKISPHVPNSICMQSLVFEVFLIKQGYHFFLPTGYNSVFQGFANVSSVVLSLRGLAIISH